MDRGQTLMSCDIAQKRRALIERVQREGRKLAAALIMQNQFAFTGARLVLNYVDPSAD